MSRRTARHLDPRDVDGNVAHLRATARIRFRGEDPTAFTSEWLHADSLAEVLASHGCALPVEVMRRNRGGAWRPAGRVEESGRFVKAAHRGR